MRSARVRDAAASRSLQTKSTPPTKTSVRIPTFFMMSIVRSASAEAVAPGIHFMSWPCATASARIASICRHISSSSPPLSASICPRLM